MGSDSIDFPANSIRNNWGQSSIKCIIIFTLTPIIVTPIIGYIQPANQTVFNQKGRQYDNLYVN